jgi:chorismate synthase
MIENIDTDPKAYEAIKDLYRPGHADYTWDAKYGRRDWRGGGRSSARETAVRVAGGAIAKVILKGVSIIGYTKQVGDVVCESFDESEIEKNPLRAPDAKAAVRMEEVIDTARKSGDSVGGIVEVRARGVKAGLGYPVYNRLDGDLASGLMGINAVKGVEIGDGFGCAEMKGSEFNDPMEMKGGAVSFQKNSAGGILGGISNGDEIVCRIAVKPTPSIAKEQETVTASGENRKVSVEGRHDPCICPRAVPVAEAMVALVLADHLLLDRASRIKP